MKKKKKKMFFYKSDKINCRVKLLKMEILNPNNI